MERRSHFFFEWVFVVNGLLYVGYSLRSRHLTADLLPTQTDWRSPGRSVLDHLQFRHPSGEASRRYNVLQKLTYLGLMFGLVTFMIVMGFARSRRLDSFWPGWVEPFGGRKSARTLHFLAACLVVVSRRSNTWSAM